MVFTYFKDLIIILTLKNHSKLCQLLRINFGVFKITFGKLNHVFNCQHYALFLAESSLFLLFTSQL